MMYTYQFGVRLNSIVQGTQENIVSRAWSLMKTLFFIIASIFKFGNKEVKKYKNNQNITNKFLFKYNAAIILCCFFLMYFSNIYYKSHLILRGCS